MRLSALATLAAASGCLFTQPINEPPVSGIQKLTEGPVHYPGEIVEFDASKSADPGSTLSFEWRTFRCASDTECVQVGPAQVGGARDPYPVALVGDTAAERHQRRRIQLTAIDADGARAISIYDLEVGNRDPGVTVQAIQGGNPVTGAVVGTRVDFATEGADPDGDPLTLSFELVRPAGSDPAAPWQPDATTARLVPDVEGIWQVVVRARDDFGGEEDVEKSIAVDADQPPCVGLADPPADLGRVVLPRAAGPRRFSIATVVDVLDPYPGALDGATGGGAARFRWWERSRRTADARRELAGERGAWITFDPAAHRAGDQVELRLEVADRVVRPPACGDDEPTCASAPGCVQRVTWRVEIR